MSKVLKSDNNPLYQYFAKARHRMRRDQANFDKLSKIFNEWMLRKLSSNKVVTMKAKDKTKGK